MTQPHLCFINSLRSWGGAEVWFLETALALKERGHKVSVVAQPDSQLMERCIASGIETLPLAIRFDAAPWTLTKLVSYFRKNKVTSILANLTKDLKAAALAGRISGVPVILGTRESDFPLKDKLYYRWYFNHLATGLLVNSKATKETTLQSAPWLRKEKVHLLYKGIDLNKFRVPENRKAQNVVGFAGQYISRKGLRTLMQAWSILENKTNSKLHLVGDGPMLPQLQTWQKSLRNPERVIIGNQTEDMPKFYHGISLLVMPSFSEGFGLVAAEALACGVPVIATRVSSLPEIITHNKTGLLIPVDDFHALAEAIEQLLSAPEKTQLMGKSGRLFVQENFDSQATLDHLEKLTGLTSSGS